MAQIVLILLLMLSLAGAVFFIVIRESEHKTKINSLEKSLKECEEELTSLDKFRPIAGIIEKANRLKEETEAKIRIAEERAETIIVVAEKKAGEIVVSAQKEAKNLKQKSIEDAELQLKKARIDVKEKNDQANRHLSFAIVEAQEIRERAEKKASEIGGKAYEALRKADFYEKAADAMHNATKGYGTRYVVPPESILDALAEQYSFHDVGQKLKIARDVVRLIEKNRAAATCEYAEAGRRETAINFVVDAFRGKVDSIKSRVKKDNYGTLKKEIEDAYALVNFNGRAFRDARITEEYLAAILDELKWAAKLQRLREEEREEQRAIQEKIREEQKAKRDFERAMKQAQRDEDMLKKAMDEIRKKFDISTSEERAKYEARLQELSEKLSEAEERNRRALSMAQQTKQGHVYIISNIGSFGEEVYKIGLTRRLDPLDRVKELGDASVPFPFDVHAMIQSDDAPALEHAIHKLHAKNQVNKINPRKEFFRLSLSDLRKGLEDMKIDVKWTLTAEAAQYRESLAIEEALKQDPEYQRQWLERQAQREMDLETEDEEIADEESLKLTIADSLD